ncbi:CoA-transferase family III [Niveomyces insectorum RCEF 264]|uniref:CoA-transferase family III n=1 Tax=Niveomyces insectorum RCEF 264 TaxID=1081102 RepID=A0A167XTE7_9HYPO|nr:CoA-transferase family III [Niveomyces insectorum RCEF 264]
MSSWLLRAAPRRPVAWSPAALLPAANCWYGHFSTTSALGSSAPTTSRTNSGALSGVKILDLTRVLAGPFCTQILADYGADVVKVEHPKGGDDTRLWREEDEKTFWKDGEATSLYFHTINRNKRSIAVNLKHAKGRQLVLDLARQADVVVENFIPGKLEQLGLGYATLKSINPSVILASISGYGATGPYAHRAGYDVIGAAEGGLLHITGEPDGAPTKPGVGLMDMCTGLYLHGAILAALRQRDVTGGRTGGGLGQHVDTSLFETTVSVTANVGMAWLNLEKEARRWGTAHPTIVPYEAFPTLDAYIVVGAVNDRQFETLCKLLGGVSDDDANAASAVSPGACAAANTTDIASLYESPLYSSNAARVQNRVALHHLLAARFAKRPTAEWERIFAGSGMPYGPVNTLQKAFAHPQAAARRMVETVPQEAAVSGRVKVLGMPVKFSESQPTMRTPPPALGQHTEEVLTEALGMTAKEIAELRKEGAI